MDTFKNTVFLAACMGQFMGCHAMGDTRLMLKPPGEKAVVYELKEAAGGRLVAEDDTSLPVEILRTVEKSGDVTNISLAVRALADCWFNIAETVVMPGTDHKECQFYMPGFWYHHNQYSPASAPSFHTSDSWLVREDRLSAPLTGVYDPAGKRGKTVLRLEDEAADCMVQNMSGELMLPSHTSVGFTGFVNRGGEAALQFGFPYVEAPRRYVSKLTLIEPAIAFERLDSGRTETIRWQLRDFDAQDYPGFVTGVWNYAYDTLSPRPVDGVADAATVKRVLSNYFLESFVDRYPLKFFSGVGLRTADCENTDFYEVGFIGRTLLNAFNAREYGIEQRDGTLVAMGDSILESVLRGGFTKDGFFKEAVTYPDGGERDVLNLRIQSEAIYAMLYYLDARRRRGEVSAEWERAVKKTADNLVGIQNQDGSFPRKFLGDGTVTDAWGGSSPSATMVLAMAYEFFNDSAYLESAVRSARYIEDELIRKGEYFSATIDANCEDKESAIYSATAMYFLSLVVPEKEAGRYMELCRRAAYFALSWYYLWDVPFSAGQMLGETGFKSRGWGNVSVENNHVDVYVFEFATILDRLACHYGDKRFSDFSRVIKTSVLQLLPGKDGMFDIAKKGFYPEVVQHTTWDYGRNGKGFCNDLFAPGWTVASLWTMLSPERMEDFFSEDKPCRLTRSGLMPSRFEAEVDGKPVRLYVLSNGSMEVCVTNYGGRIVSVAVPDRDNVMRDVVLGFDSIADYRRYPTDFGATIGRYANRIGNGRFALDGKEYRLPRNNFGHCLHGGHNGFQYQVFDAEQVDSRNLHMSYVSPDGEEGFPGTLRCDVWMALEDDNSLVIRYEADTDRPTVVNFTNHSYFNLDGDAGSNASHLLYVNADSFTPIDSTFLTTGEIVPVAGTPMDFRVARQVGITDPGDDIQLGNGQGYDHNWVLSTGGNPAVCAARLHSPKTGITLEVFTSEPGIQVYAGNFLDGSVRGKGGKTYGKRASVCLETQKFPDTPNKPQWPSAVLRPGEKYASTCIFRFSCRN